MKKAMIAMAALAATGATMAQSNATVWGVVDLGVVRTEGAGHATDMLNGNNAGANKLGFKGIEDLGSGLWAGFYLEAGFNASSGQGQEGNGGLGFNRRSSVSMGNQWGEVRLGRDFNVTFENYVLGDPFGDAGIAAAGDHLTYGPAGVNPATAYFVNNAVKYAYGYDKNDSTWGFGAKGLYAEIQYALKADAATAPNNGQYTGGRIGYAVGGLNAAVAYAVSKGPNQAGTPGSSINYKEFNVAAIYDLGVVSLTGNAGTNNSDTANTKFTHYAIGATIPVGLGAIPLSFSNVKQSGVSGSGANLFALGYVYNVSKRTATYATVTHTGNGSATSYGDGEVPETLGHSENAFTVGVRHSF